MGSAAVAKKIVMEKVKDMVDEALRHGLNAVGVNRVIQSVIMPTAQFVYTYATVTAQELEQPAGTIRKLARIGSGS